MGRPKPLLRLQNKPFIRHCLDAVFSTDIEDIVVVLGSYGEEITHVIGDLPVGIVFNDDPESEMAESVRIGLRAIDQASSGVLVCLSDHPLVRYETYQMIASAHSQNPDRIIIPVYDGRRGHPSLFPKPLADKTFAGLNLKQVIDVSSDLLTCIPVTDQGVILDIDCMEDYQRICKSL
jgi:CTP:molybdopterin cytidylyltransferase MocA